VKVVSELDARIEMKAFIDRARAPYGEWYVGITADPDSRLEEHGVDDAEDRDVRSDGERERHHDDEREARRAAKPRRATEAS